MRSKILVLIAALLATAGTASAELPRSGPLTGTWSGYLSYGSQRQHMTITINARETRGTWKISARCFGALTLDSISGGYHHYLRHVAKGGTCVGGDIDCLKRDGAALYDAVTPHAGASWSSSGTLRRMRS